MVPGCNSNSSVNKHSFPKNSVRSKKWVQAINNLDLDGLPSNELRQYRVCHIHFAKTAYKSTHIRQLLKDEAVPELLLNMSPAASPAGTNDGRDTIIDVPEDEQMDVTLQNPLIDSINTFEQDISTIYLKVLPSWEDMHKSEAWRPEAPDNNYESPIQHSVQNMLLPCSEENSAPKKAITSTPTTHKKRALLGSVTRRNKLTPVAKRLYTIASTLKKKQVKHTHMMGTLKERLQKTEKYMAMVEMKELKSLSKAQLAFVEMQIRNVHKKAKASEKCHPSCRFH